MSSISLVASLSFFIAVLPALGLPRSWEEILLIILGLISFFVALSLRRAAKNSLKEVKNSQPSFVENVSGSNSGTL